MVSKLCRISRVVIFNSATPSLGISSGSEDMLIGVFSQVDPFFHTSLTVKSSGVIPLEGMSAGFSIQEQ